MPAEREGPPGTERPGGYQAARPDQKSATTTDKPHPTAPTRQCGATPLLRRRAADRCVPLGETGNIRDPWQPWRPERLSQVQVQAAVDAARHLAAQDLHGGGR